VIKLTKYLKPTFLESGHLIKNGSVAFAR